MSVLFTAAKFPLGFSASGGSGAGGTVAQLASAKAASGPDNGERIGRMLLQIMRDGGKSVGKTPRCAFSTWSAAFKGNAAYARNGNEKTATFEK